MENLKKILIIFVVAVLFSIFVFTLIDAVYPNPEYKDFCNEKMNEWNGREVPIKPGGSDCEEVLVQSVIDECDASEGDIFVRYDGQGCVSSYECSTCQTDYDSARETHALMVFVISAILGLIAIAGGVILPTKKNPLNTWVGTGFMFGGLISIFFGTAMFFGDLHRVWRPVVIAVELGLVLWLAYKKLK